MERSKRVLIVDLDEELLILLERVLEDSGFTTTTTWDVRQGRALLQSGCFDFLVIGNRPPELDAPAFVADLRGKGLNFGCAVLGGDDREDRYTNLIDRIRCSPCYSQTGEWDARSLRSAVV
jgi:DNA-binding NtrC family response regulator